MAILINKPASTAVDVNNTVTLNTADLETFITSELPDDAFWHDSDNWKTVSFYLENSEGQNKMMLFDLEQSFDSILKFHLRTRSSTFQCDFIQIRDFSGDSIVIKRASFNSATEFDIEVTGGYEESVGTNVNWTISNQPGGPGFATLGVDGGLSLTSNGYSRAWDTTALTGDFKLTYKFLRTATADLSIGYHKTLPNSGTGFPNAHLYCSSNICQDYTNTNPDNWNTAIPNFTNSLTDETTFVIERVGSTITYNISGNHIPTYTGTIENYSGNVFPYLYGSVGTNITYAKIG